MALINDLLISVFDITCHTPYFTASISSAREGKSVMQIKNNMRRWHGLRDFLGGMQTIHARH